MFYNLFSMGLLGFVSHYPTTGANGNQLFSIFWDVVHALERWEFHLKYTCLDGASTNRNFMKMNFEGSPVTHHMGAFNSVTREHVYLLPDPSHVFKKIRNNILKSGTEKYHTRLLWKDGLTMRWSTWAKCYRWDKTHGLAIH